MNKHMRLRAAVVLVGLLALTFGVGTAVADAPFGPTITTDQPDYVPGSTVYVTGAGWAIGETVHIVVRSTDLVDLVWSTSADVFAAGDGTITYQFDLPLLFSVSRCLCGTFPSRPRNSRPP